MSAVEFNRFAASGAQSMAAGAAYRARRLAFYRAVLEHGPGARIAQNARVVIYFYDGDHSERQRTVVTETHGPLAGRRVVRGSEADYAAHYGLTGYLPAALSA